jgi:putative dehydrogenase
MIQKVGMIGLGLMGSAMSEHLLKEGYSVIGYDIIPEQIQALKKMHGTGAASCRDVAAKADVVITSLPSVAALKDAVNGKDGIAACNRKGLIVIETSTLPLQAKREAREALDNAGIVLLDCPLSGTSAQARRKDLSVYASGNRDAFDACVPVFQGFSRTHYYLGEFGTGSKMKFVANLLVAIHNVSAAEAFVLGMKAGLDPEMIYKVISDGAGSSRMFEVRGPLMVSQNYNDATMKVDIFQKDINIILSFAKELKVPLPLLSAAEQIYKTALEKGFAKQDTAAVCAVLEEMAGLKRK